MKNIYEYFEFPNVSEIHELNKDIEKIRIDVKYKIQNESAYADELDYYENVLPWINEFNFTMLNIEIPYIFVKSYYNKGLPEYSEKNYNEEEHEEKDYINKYYFNYFSRICLFEIKSNFERTMHIVSNIHDLRINYDNERFISEVMECLKQKDKILFNYLKSLYKNKTYKEIQLLRNQLTHSFSPLNTKMLPTYYDNGFTTYGVVKSKSTAEIMKIIDEGLNLLEGYIRFLEKHIENYYINKFSRK